LGTAVIITSFKGGVGKTTVSAAIGYSLSKLNKKILAIDMDFGTRGLDIALGRENIVSPTVLDL